MKTMETNKQKKGEISALQKLQKRVDNIEEKMKLDDGKQKGRTWANILARRGCGDRETEEK